MTFKQEWQHPSVEKKRNEKSNEDELQWKSYFVDAYVSKE